MRYTKKFRLGVLCAAFAILPFFACSGNPSSAEENVEGPFSVNFRNQTKQTAFIVVFICEGPDTLFSYVNPGKSNSINLQKRVEQIEFTSGLQFSVYATYDKHIVSNTFITVSEKENGDYYVFKDVQ